MKYKLYKEEKVKITKKEREIKVIIEKHSDGYVAYPLGLKGIVVG